MANWKRGLRVSLIADSEDLDLCFTGLRPFGEDALGVEIIPLEPEQRSYLRREAPSVARLFTLPREQHMHN